jgi:hypothetical protein
LDRACTAAGEVEGLWQRCRVSVGCCGSGITAEAGAAGKQAKQPHQQHCSSKGATIPTLAPQCMLTLQFT